MSRYLVVLIACLFAASAAVAAPPLGVECQSPPPAHCAQGDCAEKMANRGNAVDPATGRAFFLDYPCDLKPGEDVVFILNIHGAGSIGNWQRHYFPAMDYKEKYRLVVATPTAEGMGSFGPGPGIRMWMADKDDQHLQNIVQLVFDSFGVEHIKSFWLAGHSQGGGTSHRLVCTPFFRDKVDGLLSLSGGRIGRADIVPRFGPPMPDGSPPPPRERRFPDGGLPDCDFSHIYETGQHEIVSLPETSPWAEKYACGARTEETITDDKPGWVYDSNRAGYPVWGREARPGTAVVYDYPGCKDSRIVADVVRIDKGHTEGLEPRVTQRILQLIVSAAGGKARAAAAE
ncbi:MAG: alpha/beta hydrolase [Pseudomonadales bacterium]|nr:alpha/beta hydrolase [Pseudomonadales bacterium]